MRRPLLLITLVSLAASSAFAQAAPTKGKAAKGAVAAPPVDSVAPQYTGRQSWTSDRYRLGVGDIVTVMVNDQTLASAGTNTSASDSRIFGRTVVSPKMALI